jgi:hypothetical protein
VGFEPAFVGGQDADSGLAERVVAVAEGVTRKVDHGLRHRHQFRDRPR